jgi:hypothetical protein
MSEDKKASPPPPPPPPPIRKLNEDNKPKPASEKGT